ncbi:hypothetical protein RQP46_000930 [Phenoliferia psychrophenolica]
MDMASMMAGLHLQPGQSMLSGIQDMIEAQVYTTPSPSFRRQVWALVGMSACIIVLTVAGVTMRYRRGTGWLFIWDDQGYLRPNPSITTQSLFAIYSVVFIIAAPFYPLASNPSNAAFALTISAFPPLGLALSMMAWSTALATTASPAFLALSPVRRTRSLAKGRLATFIAIGSIVGYLGCVLRIMVLLSNSRATVMAGTQEMLAHIAAALAPGGSESAGLMALQEDGPAVVMESARLNSRSHALIYSYCGWCGFWMAVYLPSAFRLLVTLLQRRRRLIRSFKSLRILSDLVTTDEKEEEASAASPQLPPLAPNSQFSPSIKAHGSTYGDDYDDVKFPPQSSPSPSDSMWQQSPRPDSYKEYLSSASDFELVRVKSSENHPSSYPAILRKSSTSSSSSALPVGGRSSTPATAARHFAERLMDDVGIGSGSGIRRKRSVAQRRSNGTGTRGLEVGSLLRKTNRLLITISVQLVLTLAMASSALGFCGVAAAGNATPAQINSMYTSWVGWSVSGPGLVGALLFCILSLRDRPTKASPPVLAPPVVKSADFAPPTTPFTPSPPSSPPTKSPFVASPKPSYAEAASLGRKPTLSISVESPTGEKFKGQWGSGARRETRGAVSEASSQEFYEVDEDAGSQATTVEKPQQRWVPSVWVNEREREKAAALAREAGFDSDTD